MKTAQEVFNEVIIKLRQQGVQAMSEDGQCLYRGPNGTKCGAGQLISDNDYDPRMEGKAASAWKTDIKIRSWGGTVNDELVECLQHVHDFYVPGEWEEQWELLGDKYGLGVPCLEN